MLNNIEERALWLGGKFSKNRQEITRLVNGIESNNINLIYAEEMYIEGYKFKSEGDNLLVYNSDWDEYDLIIFKDLKEIITVNDYAYYSLLCLFI